MRLYPAEFKVKSWVGYRPSGQDTLVVGRMFYDADKDRMLVSVEFPDGARDFVVLEDLLNEDSYSPTRRGK